MLPTQIKEFLRSSSTNKWITFGDLNIYIRNSQRPNPRNRRKYNAYINCFDIANVTCGQKGCGQFTAFLESLDELNEYGFQAIYVEQVLNERFANFFRKRKWLEVNALCQIPSFYYFFEV